MRVLTALIDEIGGMTPGTPNGRKALITGITGQDGTLLVIHAGRTRRTTAGHGREALAKAGAHDVGAGLNRLSKRPRSDYVYYDNYAAYGAEAAAKPGSQGASVPGPLVDKGG